MEAATDAVAAGCPYNRTVQAWHAFSAAQRANLQAAAGLVATAVEHQRLPDLKDVDPEVSRAVPRISFILASD
jgi:hypothetical protein